MHQVECLYIGCRCILFRPIWLMIIRKQGSTSTTMHSDWKPLGNEEASDEVNCKPFRAVISTTQGRNVHPFNPLDWLPLHLLHLHFSLCFISTYPQDFFQIVSKTHSPCLSKTDVQPLQFLAKFPSSFSSSPFVYLACIAPYRFCQDCLPWNYGHPQSEAATMHDKDFNIHVAVVLI